MTITQHKWDSVLSISWLTLCFSAFFIPSSYAVPVPVYQGWKLWLVVVSCLFFFLVLFRQAISLRWVAFCFFFLSYYLLSTLVMGADGSIVTAATNTIEGIGFVSILEYGFKNNPRKYLISFIASGIIFLGINYGTFVMYKDVVGGMQQGLIEYGKDYATSQHWFFFTHDNGTIFFYLPTVAALWFYALSINKRMISLAVVVTALTELMYIVLGSTTALYTMGAFCLALCFILFCKKSVLFTKNSLPIVLIIGFIFNLGVVSIGILGNLSGIITEIGKDWTFNTRLITWERSIQYIIEHPFFGSGFESTFTSVLKLTYNHSHNILLQILYSGGLLSFVFYGIAHFACYAKEKSEYSRREVQVVIVSIFLYFVASCFDWYAYFVLPIILFYLVSFSKKFVPMSGAESYA